MSLFLRKRCFCRKRAAGRKEHRYLTHWVLLVSADKYRAINLREKDRADKKTRNEDKEQMMFLLFLESLFDSQR
jgi:hypothetical protein